MLKKRQKTMDVEVGSVFERPHHFNVVERVEVVSIDQDETGIPHVCYAITHIRPHVSEKQGTRVLAMSAFAERYAASA